MPNPTMTHREHFFSVLEGKKPANMPFFPDITDWYSASRTPKGEERVWGAVAASQERHSLHRSLARIVREDAP